MRSVLIVGTGGIGKRHIRGFLKTGRARLSVCEPHEARRAEVLKDYAIAEAFADLRDVPLDAYDMAVVCTPANLHIAMGQHLAEAGVPCLMEKPLSIGMDGVDELIRGVSARRLTFRVGYVQRLTPWFARLREDVLKGRVGRVRMALTNSSHDYRKYRPDYQTNYFGKPELGGGAILDMTSHHLDLLIWLMGPVREVASIYDRLELDGLRTEDSAVISLRFVSGAIAQVCINLFQKPYCGTFEVAGTEGNLQVLTAKGELRFAGDDSGDWQTEAFIAPGQSPMDVHEGNFVRQANAFLDLLEGKTEGDCLATLEDARESLRVALAARESYATRRIVSLAAPEGRAT